jgi:hypothetical protein
MGFSSTTFYDCNVLGLFSDRLCLSKNTSGCLGFCYWFFSFAHESETN